MRSLLVCAALLLLSTACAHTHDVDVAPTGTVSDAGANLAPPVGKWRLVAFADVDAAPAAEVTLVVQDDGKIAQSLANY